MNFYMLRKDLGDPHAPAGYDLVETDEQDMYGDEVMTTYVYRHIATGKYCGVQIIWSDEDYEEALVNKGRFFEEDGVEYAELAPMEQMVRYTWT